jgi:hypothetical protein
MLNILKGWRKVHTDRRAVAALEFVLVAPLLLVLFFGVYDLSSAARVYQEVYNAAHSIPSSASSMAVTSGANGATNLTYAEIQLAESQIWAQIPDLRSGFRDPLKSVTISSVVFELTNPTCVPKASPQNQCNYTPYVVWSVAYAGGDSARTFNYVLRSCAVALNQSVANAGAPSDITNIRTAGVTTPDPNVAPPSPILVVDVNLQYNPIFGLLPNSFNFWATGFWPVRSVQAIQQVQLNPPNGPWTPVLNANGHSISLTLNQQFTTITASSLAHSPIGSWCVATDSTIVKLMTPPGPTT